MLVSQHDCFAPILQHTCFHVSVAKHGPYCCVLQVDSDPYVEPECPCGMSFCFKCSRQPHSPCTCQMWNLWDEKINGDSETRNWLAANTKPCPKCSKPVEKNGGCNLVVCKCGQVWTGCPCAGRSTASAAIRLFVSGLLLIEPCILLPLICDVLLCHKAFACTVL